MRHIRESLNLQRPIRVQRNASHKITRSAQYSKQLAPDELLHARQRGIERSRVVTPGLCKIGAPATAASNLCGNRTN